MSRSTGRTHSNSHAGRSESISRTESERPPEPFNPHPVHALLTVAERIPWALLSVTVIVIASAAAGLFEHYPSDSILRHWGIGIRGLLHGKIWTIITSNFLIDHPVAIISTVVLSILATGACELRFGTWRTILIWFTGTWAPLVVAALGLIPAHLLHAQGTVDRLMISEVGSSTATWCCVGAIAGVPFFVKGWRLFAGLSALLLLLAILVLTRTFTDIEHITALLSGMALSKVWDQQPSHLNILTREPTGRLLAITCGAVFLIQVPLASASVLNAALAIIGATLILAALLLTRRVDVTLAVLLAVGGVFANVLELNAATILAVGAALWLFLYRGPWTLPETVSQPDRFSRRR